MSRAAPSRVLVIAGPTASGKSALALRLAEELGGEIINADAMQVYRDLRALTARPDAVDTARAPHRLYGHVDAAERYSAGRWCAEAVRAIEDARAAGRRPIVTGGTGFYIETLLRGLSPIPDVPAAVLAAVAEEAEQRGLGHIREELAACDPASAARLASTDRQRLIRALAVWRATGTPLSDWQKLPPEAPPVAARAIWLDPPRDLLYARCDARLAAMLEEGALEEVRALLARGLDPALPAMKALGVAELGAYLQGRLSRAVALAAAQQQTRRFAKRQLTWFRNRLGDALRVDAQFSESLWQDILLFIRKLD